jgi:hypothetical protein
VIREAFVYALDGTMLLCMAVSLMGALAALLVNERTASSEPPLLARPIPEMPRPEVFGGS